MPHFDRSIASAIVYQDALFPALPALSAVSVAMPTAGYKSLLTGTAQAGGSITPATATAPAFSTLTLAAGASSTDNAYLGRAVRITSGTASGARGTITAYVGSTKIATVNWGTGYSGSLGVPASLDATSVYELSIDCYGRGKVLIKTEYGNATCTAGIRVALRDANGLAVISQKQTPANLGITDGGTIGDLGEGFEVACDGMDTAYVFIDTAASGGTTPTVTVWAVAV